MPELAEVEYFRRRWDDGLGQRVLGVKLHLENRVFRGSETNSIQMTLPRKKLVSSETRGKQILFRFSNGAWLGIHLGMSGKLRVEAADFSPGKHDHLAIFQKGRTLLFSDPRTFGRVRFHVGKEMPNWWAKLPPAITSREFTATTIGSDSATPPAHSAESAASDAGVFPGHWKLDGRRDPLAGILAPAPTRGQSG